MDCFTFKPFGKEFIKTQKLSPDSFIQIAMQYAFYRYCIQFLFVIFITNQVSFHIGYIKHLAHITNPQLPENTFTVVPKLSDRARLNRLISQKLC